MKEPDKPKRWRPRFSVRTLVIVVTVVCCYAACWGPTKTQGVADVVDHIIRREFDYGTHNTHESDRFLRNTIRSGSRETIPFIIQFDPFRRGIRRYYFWFFGYVAKVPYELHLETEWKQASLDFDFEIDDNVSPLSPEE